MLDKQCAYYMMIGVSYDEFWYGDYSKLKYFRELHNLEIERKNQELWMQGLYFYEAICCALENAFAKSGTPRKKYPEKPHRITPLSEDEKKIEQKKQVESFRNQLMALDRRFTAKHKQEQSQSQGGV